MFNLMNKKQENFTEDERKSLLDGLTIQNRLLKSVFGLISKTTVTIKKKIVANDNVIIDKDVLIRGKLNVRKDITGKKIELTEMNAEENINVGKNINGGGTLTVSKICIGKTCIDEKHLQILTGSRDIFIKGLRKNKYLQVGNMTSNVKGTNHDHSISNPGEFIGSKKGDWEKMRFIL